MCDERIDMKDFPEKKIAGFGKFTKTEQNIHLGRFTHKWQAYIENHIYIVSFSSILCSLSTNK